MKKIYALLLFLLAAFAVIYFFVKTQYHQPAYVSINNFKDCAAAGYPVLSTDIRQCTLPSGKTFVEQLVPEH